MRPECIRVNGVENGIDFDAHYKVSGYSGIAFYLLGWKAVYEPIMCYALDDDGKEIEIESGESELVPDTSTVVAVMVGDDRRHAVDVTDLQVISESGFCRSCGQIGCHCNVYE